LRFFVQITIGLASFWSVLAVTAAVDPGVAFRAEQLLLTMVGSTASTTHTP
jgi:hypothetical protein